MGVCSCDSGKTEKSDWPEPYILSVSTEFEGNKAVTGKPVTVKGYNFSSVISENTVVSGFGYDAVSLRVTSATESKIVFNAPKISGDEFRFRVAVNGKESNQVLLKYDNSLGGDTGDVEDEEPVDLTAMLNAAKKETIREGVEWILFHGVWEGQVRNINIVKTTLNDDNRLGIYFEYANTEEHTLDKKCVALDALVGTNGPMACCHFVRVDGEIKHAANGSDAYYIDNGALVIDGDNVDILSVQSNFDAVRLPYKTVGVGGPMLVYDGKIQRYPEESTDGDFLYTTHPRTAIGISKDKKTVYQVAVDGRWTSGSQDKRAIGMETWVLAKLMKGLGCHRALNFDGGGGTAMWIYGKGVNGIVNHPCESPKNWDNPTLRATGCAVYVMSDLK